MRLVLPKTLLLVWWVDYRPRLSSESMLGQRIPHRSGWGYMFLVLSLPDVITRQNAPNIKPGL